MKSIKEKYDIGVSFKIGKYTPNGVEWLSEPEHNFITEAGLEMIYKDWFANLTKYVFLGTSDTPVPEDIEVVYIGSTSISVSDYIFTSGDIGKTIMLPDGEKQIIASITNDTTAVLEGSFSKSYTGKAFIYSSISDTLISPSFVSNNYDTSEGAIFNSKTVDPVTEIVTITNTRSVIFEELSDDTNFKEIGWSNNNNSGINSNLFGRKNIDIQFKEGDIPYIRVSLIRKINCSPVTLDSTNILGISGSIDVNNNIHNKSFDNKFYSYINTSTGECVVPTITDTILEGYNPNFNNLKLIASDENRDLTINNSNLNSISELTFNGTAYNGTAYILDTIKISDSVFVVSGYNFIKSFNISSGNIVGVTLLTPAAVTLKKLKYIDNKLYVMGGSSIYIYDIDTSTGVLTAGSYSTIESASSDIYDFDILNNGNVVYSTTDNTDTSTPIHLLTLYNITSEMILDSITLSDVWTDAKANKCTHIGDDTIVICSPLRNVVVLKIESDSFVLKDLILANAQNNSMATKSCEYIFDNENLKYFIVKYELFNTVFSYDTTSNTIEKVNIFISDTILKKIDSNKFLNTDTGELFCFNLNTKTLILINKFNSCDLMCLLSSNKYVFITTEANVTKKIILYSYTSNIINSISKMSPVYKELIELDRIKKILKLTNITDELLVGINSDGDLETYSINLSTGNLVYNNTISGNADYINCNNIFKLNNSNDLIIITETKIYTSLITIVSDSITSIDNLDTYTSSENIISTCLVKNDLVCFNTSIGIFLFNPISGSLLSVSEISYSNVTNLISGLTSDTSSSDNIIFYSVLADGRINKYEYDNEDTSADIEIVSTAFITPVYTNNIIIKNAYKIDDNIFILFNFYGIKLAVINVNDLVDNLEEGYLTINTIFNISNVNNTNLLSCDNKLLLYQDSGLYLTSGLFEDNQYNEHTYYFNKNLSLLNVTDNKYYIFCDNTTNNLLCYTSKEMLDLLDISDKNKQVGFINFNLNVLSSLKTLKLTPVDSDFQNHIMWNCKFNNTVSITNERLSNFVLETKWVRG